MKNLETTILHTMEKTMVKIQYGELESLEEIKMRNQYKRYKKALEKYDFLDENIKHVNEWDKVIWDKESIGRAYANAEYWTN